MRRRSIMPKPVQRVTVPSCLCEVGQKVHPGPTPMAPAVHENDRPPALNGCECHEALNAHAMNSVLRLIHAKPRLLMSIFQSAFRGRSDHLRFRSSQCDGHCSLCSVRHGYRCCVGYSRGDPKPNLEAKM